MAFREFVCAGRMHRHIMPLSGVEDVLIKVTEVRRSNYIEVAG
jgi:hypothetical protein